LSRAMERLNASLSPADVGILYLWDDRSTFHATLSFGCDADALVVAHQLRQIGGGKMLPRASHGCIPPPDRSSQPWVTSPGNRRGPPPWAPGLRHNVLCALRVGRQSLASAALHAAQRQQLPPPPFHPDAGRSDGLAIAAGWKGPTKSCEFRSPAAAVKSWPRCLNCAPWLPSAATPRR
jgi:hypothetical protein